MARFESVASDALIPGITSFINNSWGLHQPRIVTHNDGTVRLVYLTQMNGTSNPPSWRLMKRDPGTGKWAQEAAAQTTDDVTLTRDANSDKAHVVAYVNSVPTTYSSPSYKAAAIPGSWEVMDATSRHYGNTGISLDGTLCLKTSKELTEDTSDTDTQYNCGTYNASADTWNWSGFISHDIGTRHAYDYLFPNPAGLAAGLYATSTADMYKSASNDPWSEDDYVFNGTRFWKSALASDSSWSQTDTTPPQPVKSGQTDDPVLREIDSMIDSQGRVYTSYEVDDPENSSAQGLYTEVSDSTGKILSRTKMPLPPYGYLRMYEDSKNRLWVLWNNEGTQETQVMLYPVTSSSGSSAITLGSPTDLSAAFNPYSIHGNLYIASPRGGNAKGLTIDAIYNTCWTTYQSGQSYDSNNCYNSDNSGSERVFYAQIRLPD